MSWGHLAWAGEYLALILYASVDHGFPIIMHAESDRFAPSAHMHFYHIWLCDRRPIQHGLVEWQHKVIKWKLQGSGQLRGPRSGRLDQAATCPYWLVAISEPSRINRSTGSAPTLLHCVPESSMPRSPQMTGQAWTLPRFGVSGQSSPVTSTNMVHPHPPPSLPCGACPDLT